MDPAPPVFTIKLEPEDQARAGFYALLARLFSAPPDATLLSAIAAGPEVATEGHDSRGADFAGAWRTLADASAAAVADRVAEEYQELFVGVGRSEVSLYGSSYVKASSGKRLLVGVREALNRLGLERQPGATMFEDHLTAVFETMRMLITHGGQQAATLEEQREFFSHNIEPWVFACCAAITAKTVANYYARVAQFTESFMALERDAFAME
jgi:TorA maturation chaperone TorD